jgi:hypothetical protein
VNTLRYGTAVAGAWLAILALALLGCGCEVEGTYVGDNVIVDFDNHGTNTPASVYVNP